MVKKPAKKAKVTQKKSVIPPESWTGYPTKKPCSCPSAALSKAAGGGKSAS